MNRPVRAIFILLSIWLALAGLQCSRHRDTLTGRIIPGQPIPDDALLPEMKQHRVPGVSIAVIHAGRIVWSKGYGVRERGAAQPVDTTTIFQAASISKPVSAVVALRLVRAGLLSLDEDVNTRLRSWKVPTTTLTAKRPVTLRGILSHTAGLSMHSVPEFSAGDTLRSLVEILNGAGANAREAVRPVIEPGSAFRYSGGGYVLLQVLLGDITGRPYAGLAHEQVLDPVGMSSSTFEQPLPNVLWPSAALGHLGSGVAMNGGWHILPEEAAGGLWTTPRDLASFLIAVWNAYHGRADTLLPRSLAREMLTRQTEEFGLGFSIPKAGAFRFQHGGGNGGYRCHMVMSAEEGNGLVIMTNSDNGEELINELLVAIGKAAGWYPS